VLAVVAFHAFPSRASSGFIGVDVFFVISGYLISGIILGDLARATFSYQRFYARRVRRIFPALALVLGASLLVGWLKLFPDEFESLGRQATGSAAFVANIVLWRQSGYFDQAAAVKPLLHLWSLGVEEQFYLVWPTTLALIGTVRRRLAIVLALLGGSFLLNVIFIGRSPDATFYLPMTRLWELLLGAIVALSESVSRETLAGGRARGSFGASTGSTAMAWAGLLLLMVGFLVLDSTYRFPGWWALLPTVGTALMIAAGPSTWLSRRLLSRRLLVAFGLISYPLYLWHWPLLSFLNILRPSAPSSARILIVLVSVLLATATYRLLEVPIRFGRRRRFIIPALGASMAVAGLIGVLAGEASLVPLSARGKFRQIWDAAADWTPFGPGFHRVPSMSKQVLEIGENNRAHVLFMGDSNIEQYGPRIARVLATSPERHASVFVAATGGCPPIPLVREKLHPDCARAFDDYLQLATSKAVARVVVGACWICYLRQDRGPNARFQYYLEWNGKTLWLNDGPLSDEAALSGLRQMLALLSAAKETYLLLNIPAGTSADPRSMIHRDLFSGHFSYQRPVLTRKAVLDNGGELRGKLISIAHQAGAVVIDPLDFLCPDKECPTLAEDGRPVYRDANHLRAFFVIERASFIDETLRLP
jgi:peptidoglycan/LPS O-acetylase OafA/YrhL